MHIVCKHILHISCAHLVVCALLVYSQLKLSAQIRMLSYISCAALFCLQGWLKIVSQHRHGKQGRLITLDSHKWNANGLWNHIKASDGCEWCQKTRAWFACHSVTFRLFSVPILMEIDVYMGWQERKEKKEHSKPWGEREKMGGSGWRLIDDENQNGEIAKGLTCHVNKWKWGSGKKKKKKSTTVPTQDRLH